MSGFQTQNCRTITASHLFKAKAAAHRLCPMSAFGGKARKVDVDDITGSKRKPAQIYC